MKESNINSRTYFEIKGESIGRKKYIKPIVIRGIVTEMKKFGNFILGMK